MKTSVVLLLCVLLFLSLSPYSMAADSSNCITKDEAIADVNQFFETLQRVHPDLLAKVDVEDYIKLKQQTLDDIGKQLDQDGKISVNDLAYILCYAGAFFGDGHTSVYWGYGSNESNTEGKMFPPFLLGYDNGRFVVTALSNKSMEGLEVLSVNGEPIREFLRPIMDRISGETFAWKAACFINMQPFWYCFSGLFDSYKSLALKLQDVQGKQSEQKVDTVSFADFQKLISDISATKPDQPREQGTRVSFLDSDRIAYFIYPYFSFNDDEKKKIDGIFKEIESKKSQDLIIDIRGNGGGTSNMGDFIFRYLREDEFPSTSKIRTKVSRDILSSSYTKFMEQVIGAEAAGQYSEYLNKKFAGLEGVVVTDYIEDETERVALSDLGKGEPVSKLKGFFSGRIFLLVDNGTFSSASMFATTFRDYGVGKILGYETGGVPVSYTHLTLPTTPYV